LIEALHPHYARTREVETRPPYGAVFSRYALSDAETLDLGNGVLRAVIEAPHPFVLLAAHLDRPSISPGGSGYVSHGQHYDEVVAMQAAVAHETLPVVIAGDLNMSDRVRGYRYLDARYRDLIRDGWAGSTYIAGIYRYFLLRIDHVFATDDWCSERVDEFSITGSDHRGIRLDVADEQMPRHAPDPRPPRPADPITTPTARRIRPVELGDGRRNACATGWRSSRRPHVPVSAGPSRPSQSSIATGLGTS
jgi:hypothetical protein